MPKITKPMGEGHGRGELYPLLLAGLVDIAAQKVIIDNIHDAIADIKAKYEDHRHSAAGAAGTGTKPSTAGAAAAADASTITALTATKTALTVTS